MADATSAGARTSLSADTLAGIASRLRPANDALARRYPGDTGLRQPVHTYYMGAHHFTASSVRELGDAALHALEEYAPDAESLADAVGLPRGGLTTTVRARVAEKLRREPVEDLRVDYEDGYGVRPDAEEDAHAAAGARAVTIALRAGTLPPFVGVRVKPLTTELHARSLRTLDLFLTTLVEEGAGVPPGFMVTLPKVTLAAQADAFADALEALEEHLGLAEGSLRFEAMVETPQVVLDASGRSALPALIEAARGRLAGAHLGVYDYTASLGIAAAHQRLRHEACDFVRHVMQVALAGTGVTLSDGSTTVLPVPVHDASSGVLSEKQREENRESVHRGWRMHYDDVRHSLAHAYYQGWDLHPAQLVTRYAAVFAFFLEGSDRAAERLRAFVSAASQNASKGLFEEVATAQALLNFLLRGVNAGALAKREVAELTGLATEELGSRSVARILAGRRR